MQASDYNLGPEILRMVAMRQPNMPGYEPSEADLVREALRRPLAEKIANAAAMANNTRKWSSICEPLARLTMPSSMR